MGSKKQYLWQKFMVHFIIGGSNVISFWSGDIDNSLYLLLQTGHGGYADPRKRLSLKYFAILNWVLDLLAGSCIFTWNKLIKAKGITPLSFVNYFLILKLSSKAATGVVLQKSHVPKTLDIFTQKHLCWSLALIKLQDFRTVARLTFYNHTEDSIFH